MIIYKEAEIWIHIFVYCSYNMFEPFYTTKKPGDGVGLGLAISSGIVSDLGGRLIARNATSGGAVFEIQMPILNEKTEAAE